MNGANSHPGAQSGKENACALSIYHSRLNACAVSLPTTMSPSAISPDAPHIPASATGKMRAPGFAQMMTRITSRIMARMIGALTLFILPAIIFTTDAHARTIAVFKCELFDTSGDVIEENLRAQDRRLNEVTAILRDAVDRSQQYEVVNMDHLERLDTPYARFAKEGLFSECNGCESDVAKMLGAEKSMGCLIQKVSNLILNMNLYIRDTSNGNLLEVFAAAIRGNDDVSWHRSMQWIIRNRLFEDPEKKEARMRRLRGEPDSP